VALNGPAKDDDAAAKFLDMARRSADDRTDTRLMAEYHYRALQLATRRNNDSERRSHADWIVQRAEGSAFELPALVIVAKGIDDQVKGSGRADRQLLENGQQVYERLVERFGDDPETLRNTKNAQVAVSRLAFYAEELEEHATAARLLTQLLAAYPADAGYLRRAGLATYRAGEFAAALDYWRKLAAGLPDRSDEWFEAKYYQLASLAQVDRAKAREALAQFRLLYPQLGPPAWRGKFVELQQRVE
jgi:tetratricopeptide (TPR) repeat protein